MLKLLSILLILTSTTTIFCETCIKYDFENDFEYLFLKNSTACQSFSSWEIENYSDILIRRPNVESTKFISPARVVSQNEWQLLNNCIRSFGFPMEAGGIVEIMFYIEAISQRDILYVTAGKIVPGGNDVEVGFARYSMTSLGYKQGWNILKMDISGRGEKFDGYIYFYGTVTEGANILVDSFRYIGPNGGDENCEFELITESATEYPTTIIDSEAAINDEHCTTYDFENDYDTLFNNETDLCSGSLSWESQSYTSINIKSPHVQSSTFITPASVVADASWQTFSSCVSSFKFAMVEAGSLEVNLYMEAKTPIDILYVDVKQITTDGSYKSINTVTYSMFHADYSAGWKVLKIDVQGTTGRFDGFVSFLGVLGEGSILLVDSFRYVSSTVSQESCVIYTDVETTVNPTTENPTTVDPTTVNPTTEKPTTIDLTTEIPTTINPMTIVPTTEVQTTDNPTTENPTTVDLTTEIQTTVDPTTVQPTTDNPTTINPTTIIQTTEAQSTVNPTTFDPTTEIQTTVDPTTENPTTIDLTTEVQTTVDPTTVQPTTDNPTTTEPTIEIQTTVNPTTDNPTTVNPTTDNPTTIKITTEILTTINPTTDNPTPSSPVDEEDCIIYDFENDFDSKFNNDSSFCYGFPSWQLDSYTNVNVVSPHAQSNNFIAPTKVLSDNTWQTFSSCVTSFTFLMEVDGIIEVKFYMEAKVQSDNLLVAASRPTPNGFDVIVNLASHSPIDPNYTDGWNTLRIKITEAVDAFEGHLLFLGTVSENAVLIVDSFRYIGPTSNEESCVVYTDAETTTSIPTTTTISPIEEDLCVTYDFEDNFDNLFTDDNYLCVGFTTWHLGNYSSVGINGLDASSDTFMTPNRYLSCIVSFPFSMSPGGTVEVNVFMDSVSNLDYITVLAKMLIPNGIDTVAGMVMYNPSSAAFVSGWNVLRFTIASLNDFNGYLQFLGAATDGAIVVVDSFRYIPPTVSADHESCAIY